MSRSSTPIHRHERIHESTSYQNYSPRRNHHDNEVVSDPFPEVYRSNRHTHQATYPCLYPKFRNMEIAERRYTTFTHTAEWPFHRIRASPREISQAGFFYLGDSDKVKCWYCGGGLQNWDRDDEPWEEHAKWYPTCEYLLQQRGLDFVRQVSSRYPNLRRPVLEPTVSGIGNPTVRIVQSRGVSTVEISSSGSSFQIIGPTEPARQPAPPPLPLPRRVENELRSQIATRARNMGFDVDLIRTAIRRKLESGGRFSSAEELVDAVLNLLPSNEPGPSARAAPPANQDPSLLDVENMSIVEGAREIERLEASRRCQLCGNEQANVVFIPCGHLVCCEACGRNVRHCLVCRAAINERVRTYLS